MEWWGLPTRPEWALAPERGVGDTKLGPFGARMTFGHLRALGAGTEVLFPCVEAGGQSPGRFLG